MTLKPNVPAFTYGALRARKARAAKQWASRVTADVSLLCGFVTFLGGLVIVFRLDSAFGWLIAGLAGPLVMLWAYIVYELQVLDADPSSADIALAADGHLLGLLPEAPTPQQLARIVQGLPAGQFFAARYGIDFSMLAPVLSTQPQATMLVWQEALRLRAVTNALSVDDGLLAAALVKTMPDGSGYAAVLQLGLEDLDTAAGWYTRIKQVIAESQRHHGAEGGIGRDWSFGYTPLLTHFGKNITEHIRRAGLLASDVPSRQPVFQQVMQLMTSGTRRNATIVGKLGSGKTALVHALARKLDQAAADVPPQLRYHQVIALDPSTLIAQAHQRGELEQLVQQLFYEALSAKNTILFLDDAQLFFEDGNGAVDLSSVLLPVLEGGAMQLILAMDEQRWLQIAQRNPALVQYLNRLALPPADREETGSILRDKALLAESRQKVTYMFQALESVYTLSERYGADQAQPGRAITIMEAAARYGEGGLVTPHSVEQAVEQMMGVKVGTADTAAERDALLNLESLIHERMIGQSRAVQVVSDALRRARAGVRNPRRPIGTFLFLGPTGVGKSELAKSVAAVFFGGEDHLVRLDLNEFSGPGDVGRLIADPAVDEHSLTAQIIRQPFSVVLLDEIEKAHPNVLNTLLQMLDEGILRDANNREVSFRDAVIIATSNAGADRIRQHIEAGEALAAFETQFTDELISSQSFRPEFLNRFDEIVLFAPLSQRELGRVIDLLLADVNRQLSAQKIAVDVDGEAKQLLVAAGYDPRLGARPMRRIVQRAVENIVANQMLSQQVTAGQTVHITAADVQAMLGRAQPQAASPPAPDNV